MVERANPVALETSITAMAEGQRFGGNKQTEALLIQMRCQSLETPPDVFNRIHAASEWKLRFQRESPNDQMIRLFRNEPLGRCRHLWHGGQDGSIGFES